jgi:hypothetical protein
MTGLRNCVSFPFSPWCLAYIPYSCNDVDQGKGVILGCPPKGNVPLPTILNSFLLKSFGYGPLSHEKRG